jgi:glucosylceramidase
VPAPPAGAPFAGGGRGGFGGGAFPRGYKVDVSNDGTAWKTVAEGKGAGQLTTIAFAPAQARFVRITQTDTVENAPVWSIQRLRLYRSGTK